MFKWKAGSQWCVNDSTAGYYHEATPRAISGSLSDDIGINWPSTWDSVLKKSSKISPKSRCYENGRYDLCIAFNLTDAPTAVLLRRWSIFRAILQIKNSISRLRDLARSYAKTSYCVFNSMMTSSKGNIFRITDPMWPVNSPHKGQWRGVLMFSRINGWVNNREAGDLRRLRAYYEVIVMQGLV